jgi:hypothetical protein
MELRAGMVVPGNPAAAVGGEKFSENSWRFPRREVVDASEGAQTKDPVPSPNPCPNSVPRSCCA